LFQQQVSVIGNHVNQSLTDLHIYHHVHSIALVSLRPVNSMLVIFHFRCCALMGKVVILC